MVEGANTSTLVIHVYAAYAMEATTINGLGASTNGGSISFGSASRSEGPVSLGTFTFVE